MSDNMMDKSKPTKRSYSTMKKVINHKKPNNKQSFVKSSQPSSTSTDSVIEIQQFNTIDHTSIVETEEIKMDGAQERELETLEQQPNTATKSGEEEKANLVVTSARLQQNVEAEPPTLPLDPPTEVQGVAEAEQQPNTATKTSDEAEADLGATSARLSQKSEPEPPTLPLDLPTEMQGQVEGEPKFEQAQELQPNMKTETDEEEQVDLEATSDCLQQNPEPEPLTLPLNPTTEVQGIVEAEPESALLLESEVTFKLESKVTSRKDKLLSDEVSESKKDKRVVLIQETLSSIEQDDFLLTTAIATAFNETKRRQMNAPFTLVNHENGKRGKIGKAICDQLDLKEGSLVDVYIKDQSILICKSLNNQGHTLNKGNLIYNKELVEMITEACQLNFEGRSSHSFTQVKYVQSQGRLVAVITV